MIHTIQQMFDEISAFPSGTKFEVNKLKSFNNSTEDPRMIGIEFKKAVKSNSTSHVRHIGFTPDRHDHYEKI